MDIEARGYDARYYLGITIYIGNSKLGTNLSEQRLAHSKLCRYLKYTVVEHSPTAPPPFFLSRITLAGKAKGKAKGKGKTGGKR